MATCGPRRFLRLAPLSLLVPIAPIGKKTTIVLGYKQGGGASGKTAEITDIGKMRDQQSVKPVGRQKATQSALPALVLHQESVATV